MKQKPLRTSILLTALALGLLPAADAFADDTWSWVAAPYLWASSVQTDLRDNAPPVGSDTDFDDIISKLDMAFQMRVEGRGDRFGVFGDVTWLSLSDSGSKPAFSTHAALQTTLFDAGGVWNLGPERFQGLELLAGLRYVQADLDLAIDPTIGLLPVVRTGIDKSFADGLVGIGYIAALSDRWTLIARADGSWGQTDGTVGAGVMAGYRMGKGSLLFGYRYFDMTVGESGRSMDVTLSGPIVSFAFGL